MNYVSKIGWWYRCATFPVLCMAADVDVGWAVIIPFPWASYQICKIAGYACTGNAGNVSPPSRVSDPDMHQVTCVMHVTWSLTSCFVWSRWRGGVGVGVGGLYRHSRRLRNPQYYVSGKRPMPHMNGGLAKLPFNLCHGGVITCHDKQRMWLLILIVIYDYWYLECPIPVFWIESIWPTCSIDTY